MQIEQLLKLKSQRGSTEYSDSNSTKQSITSVISACRKALQDRVNEYREKDAIAKKEKIKDIIIEYVMNTKPIVDGYIKSNNTTDTQKLINKLIEDITNYGCLTSAMNDESIYEIRGNGREIKIERKGRIIDLRDQDGKIVRFETVEQQEIIIRKLLGDVKYSPKDQLVNGSTVEGYRIAVVHCSALSDDVNDSDNNRYHAFVLRKHKRDKMEMSDIVKNETMSDNMARFISLCPLGDLTFFTVGPTASGKTTTNNAILQSIPDNIRTIAIQNPSEIDMRKKDASGRVVNDVLHLEAKEMENPLETSATMENCMNHILRLSPNIVSLGELRKNIEFKKGMIIMQAGHAFNATFHAGTAKGGIGRYARAYLAESGNEPSELVMASLAELVDIIIVQKIMKDGRRRIVEIAEVIGVDPNNKNDIILNQLYTFEADEEPEYGEYGEITEIRGHHKRVGTLSEKTAKKFTNSGVSRKRFDFLLKGCNANDVETYTGNNISNYGLNIGGNN